VRVNCVCPGFIATPMFSRVLGLPAVVDATVVETLERGIPELGQMGRADDVARAALWLASDESRHVNGHALVVDNGGNGGVSWSQFGSRFTGASRSPGSGGPKPT
jgi:NAD(P)-dependent dehydrogenase (short-subunit alcohol dehydrogenase family)